MEKVGEGAWSGCLAVRIPKPSKGSTNKWRRAWLGEGQARQEDKSDGE